ncbi:hypothetical protein DID75_04435, partial [Candidatus Marinamargulisbacteria bacterium SCGC AG-410-N11]
MIWVRFCKLCSLIWLIIYFSCQLIGSPDPITMRLDLFVENNSGPLNNKHRLLVQLRSDTEVMWQQEYNNDNKVPFSHGRAIIYLGDLDPSNPLKTDYFNVPTPNFGVHIENQWITVNMTAIPYTFRSRHANSIEWHNIKGSPNYSNYSRHGDFLSIAVSKNIQIGSEQNLSDDLKLTVTGHSVFNSDVSIDESLQLATLNVQTIFVAGQKIANQEEANKLNKLASLRVANDSFLIASGNQWTTINSQQAYEKFKLAHSLSPTYNHVGIDQLFPKGNLHIGENTLIVTADRVGLFTAKPNGSFHLNHPQSNETMLLATQNTLLIGTEILNPKFDDKLLIDGDLTITGKVIGNIVDSNIEDLDFNIIRESDLYFNKFNPTIYRLQGSIGIGSGDPKNSNPAIKNTIARLDITSEDGNQGQNLKTEQLALLTARHILTTQNMTYFTIKAPHDNGRIGVHTDKPKGVFHVSNHLSNGTADTLVITQNRIGIGTAFPNSDFHIKDTNPFRIDSINQTHALYISPSGNTGVYTSSPKTALHINEGLTVSDSNSIGPGSIVFRNNQLLGFITPTQSIVLAQENQWNSGDNNLYYDSGYIGVNNTIPTSSLDIHSKITHPIQIDSVSSSNRLRMATNGYLGLGVNTPTAQLHVNGGLKLANSNQAPIAGHIRFQDNQFQGYDGNQWITLGSDNQWQRQNQRLIYEKGHVAIGLATPNSALTVSGNMIVRSKDQVQWLVTRNGFIGVGTLTPKERLDLPGAMIIGNTTLDNPKSGTIYFDSNQFKGVTPTSTITIGTAKVWEPYLTNLTSGNLMIGTTEISADSLVVSGDVIIRNNNKPAFLIKHNKVGIGISNPQYTLHVSGNAQFYSQQNNPVMTVSNNHGVALGITTTNYGLQVRQDNPFRVDSSIEPYLMRLTPRGNLAIGTNNATEQVSVSGSLIVSNSVVEKKGIIRLNNSIFEGYDGNQWKILALSAQWTRLNPNSIYYDSGNVGMGVRSPSTNLHVSGNILINSFNSNQSLVITNNGKIGIGTRDPIAQLHIKGSHPFMMTSSTGNSLLMVSRNGFIGIGTTNTTEQLVLNEGFRVGWYHSYDNPLPGTIWNDGTSLVGTLAPKNYVVLATPYQWSIDNNIIYYNEGSVSVGPYSKKARFNV